MLAIFILLAVVFGIDPMAFELPPLNLGVLLAATGLAGLASFGSGRQARRAFATPVTGPLLAVGGWLLITVLGALFLPHPGTALPDAAVILALLLVAMFAREDAWSHPLRLPAAMVAIGAGCAALALAQAWGCDPLFDNPQRAAVSVFGNTNRTGQFLAPLLPLSLMLVATARLPRVIGILGVPLITAGVVAAGSRAALLAVLLALVALPLSGPLFGLPGRRALGRSGIALLISGVVLAVAIGGIGVLRFKQVEDSAASITSLEYPTNQQRLLLATATLDMIAAHPLLGHGPGTFRAAFPPYRRAEEAAIPTLAGAPSEAEDPHNQYLLLLAQGGLVALLLFLAFALPALIGVRQAALLPEQNQGRTIAPGLAAALLALLLLGAFRSVLEHPPTALLLFLLAGSLLAYRDFDNGPATAGRLTLLAPLFLLGLTALGATLIASNVSMAFAAREMEAALSQADFKRALQSEQLLGRAEQLDPDNIHALEVRAAVLDRLGQDSPMRRDEAAQVRRRTLAYYPYNASARIGLALYDIENGAIDQAAAGLRRIRAPGVPDPRDPHAMIDFLRARNRPLALSRYLVHQARAGVISLADITAAADAQGNTPDLAIAALSAFLELRPYHGDVAWRLAGMQESRGDANAARDAYHRAHIAYALEHLAAHDYPAATRSATLANKREPSPEADVIAALARAGQGDDALMDQWLAARGDPLPKAFLAALKDLAANNRELTAAIDAIAASSP